MHHLVLQEINKLPTLSSTREHSSFLVVLPAQSRWKKSCASLREAATLRAHSDGGGR